MEKEPVGLVLSRKKDEAIIIGDGINYPIIRILMVELRGDKARIAVKADKSIPVHREEVFEQIKAEGRIAAAS